MSLIFFSMPRSSEVQKLCYIAGAGQKSWLKRIESNRIDEDGLPSSNSSHPALSTSSNSSTFPITDRTPI
jgi:hypothetical protein